MTSVHMLIGHYNTQVPGASHKHTLTYTFALPGTDIYHLLIHSALQQYLCLTPSEFFSKSLIFNPLLKPASYVNIHIQ